MTVTSRAPVLKCFKSGDFSSVLPAARLQVNDSRFVLTPPGETEPSPSSSVKAAELQTICARCRVPFPSGLVKNEKQKHFPAWRNENIMTVCRCSSPCTNVANMQIVQH